MQTVDYRNFKYIIDAVISIIGFSPQRGLFKLIVVKVCNAPVILSITLVSLNHVPVYLFTGKTIRRLI